MDALLMKMPKTLLYDGAFYATRDADSASSAATAVSLLHDILAPRSVVDVGCGVGTWLRQFSDHGVETIVGLDGPWVEKKHLVIPRDAFFEANFEEPLSLPQTFDLALSLEVAEHVSPENAQQFVHSLVELAPMVLFGAAIPHQGGVGHVNEQWPDFWARLFGEEDYVCIDWLRWQMWHLPEVLYWYPQNTLLYINSEHLKTSQLLQETFASFICETPPGVVHPDLFVRHAARIARLETQLGDTARDLERLKVERLSIRSNLRALGKSLARAWEVRIAKRPIRAKTRI